MDNTQPGDLIAESMDVVSSELPASPPGLRGRILKWLKSNQTLLTNTASLIGTMFITSGLGFFYSLLQARIFDQADVGYANALVSVMQLIATVGILGLGSLLVGELAVNPKRGGHYIAATLYVTGGVGIVMSLGFLILVPIITPDLQTMIDPLLVKLMFVVGVIMTTWGNIMDQAVIGLLIGKLQLWRNAMFSILKLSVILGVFVVANQSAFMYGTWVFGLVASMFMVWWMLGRQGVNSFATPDWSFMRRSIRTAAGHHSLNLLLKAPSYLMPVIILSVVGATSTASFYIAWQIAAFTFILPGSVTTVLYAVGAANKSILSQKMRVTVAASFGIGIFTIIAMAFLAYPVLDVFGKGYTEAATSLQIMALAIFPITIREHYVAICRIYKDFRSSSIIMLISDTIQIIAIVIGAYANGLTGLTMGWFIAICIEGIITSPTLYRVMTNTYDKAPPPPKVTATPNSAD